MNTVYLSTFIEVVQSPIFMLFLSCVVVDILLGNIRAFVKGGYNSDIGIKGTLKHAGMISFILLVLPNAMFFLNLGGELNGLILYFVFQYIMSIIENLALLGFKIPPRLLKMFSLFNEDGSVKDNVNLKYKDFKEKENE